MADEGRLSAMSGAAPNRVWARWVNAYGMAGALLLLCAFFSFATLTKQQPRGAAAARTVAEQVQSAKRPELKVLIIASTGEDDVAFAGELQSRLKSGGITVVETVNGDPRAARQALQRLAQAGTAIEFIATTSECAAWTVLENLPEKFPALGRPQLVRPLTRSWPTFLKADNLRNVANQTAVVGILAAGMTLVILTGGIDLSVGSLIALSAVLCALLIRDAGGGVSAGAAAMWASGAAAVLACAIVGAGSGLLITVFQMPPFIATLGVMLMAKGLAFKLAGGESIYELPDSFTWLGRGQGFLAVPHAVLLMAIIYAATHLLMSRTALGRYVYAVGGNRQAAHYSGVPVRRVLCLAYTLCGALAGLGGVLMASQLKSGAPTYGFGEELTVIAAVVVGGASLNGGQGNIFGTLIGAFIIAVIKNGMNLMGVDSYNQMIVLGGIILAAVLVDNLKKRGWRAFTG